MNKIYVINGPNMNMLGKRSPEIYGTMTLDDINIEMSKIATQHNLHCIFLQSNSEGDIVSFIQEAYTNACAIIINPAALSHYSYAIRDALEMLSMPKIEVHMTDILNREGFRQQIVTGEVCDHIICGKKENSYYEALHYIIERIKQ